MKEHPEEKERGMLARFAAHLGMSKIYLSNISAEHKVIGGRTARAIERELKLSEGWMDVDHSRDEWEMSGDDQAFQESVMAVYRQAPEAARALLLRSFQALLTGKPLEEALVEASIDAKKRTKS